MPRMAVQDQMRAAAKAPPNLRQGTNNRACGMCRHYRATSTGAGRCKLFADYPVRPTQVSDAFAPSGGATKG